MRKRMGAVKSPTLLPQRILLLAMLPIGDTLFALPTLRAIRHQYPHAHITMLVHSQTRALVQQVSDVDEVVVFPTGKDWQGPARLLRVLRHLRALRFDVSVDLTSPAYKWINWVTGIPLSAYMKFDPGWWYRPQPHLGWRSTHATQHYFACARELSLAPWEEQEHAGHFHLPAAEREAARRFLRDTGVELPTDGQGGRKSRPLVVVHAGGAGLQGLKRWPVARFAVLCSGLQRDWDAQIVLLGGPEDADLTDGIAEAAEGRVISAVGKLPLLASVSLIGMASLFVGNDSSPLHFAAAVGTPYVGIFGPTCVANFRPMGVRPNQGVVVEPRVPCHEQQFFIGGDVIWQHRGCTGVCQALASIAVGDVLDAAATLLSRRFEPTARNDATNSPTLSWLDSEQPPVGKGEAVAD